MSEENTIAKVLSHAEARSRLLRTRKPATKIVEFDGDRFMIVAPTVGQRSEVVSAAFVDGQTTMSGMRYTVGVLIACLHTIAPDGQPGVPVFSEADRDQLMADPADGTGVIDVLGNAVVAFINEAAAKKDTLKNGSSATPS